MCIVNKVFSDDSDDSEGDDDNMHNGGCMIRSGV